MRKIRRSVHCGFAAAKQAAQRYAEEVYFQSILSQDMADNVTGPEHLSGKYIVVNDKEKKQVVCILKKWMLNNDHFLYRDDVTEKDVTESVDFDSRFSLRKCTVMHRCDDYNVAEEVKVCLRTVLGYNTDIRTTDETVPCAVEKPQRAAKRKLADYPCTSEELEVAEVESGFAPVQFRVVNILSRTFSPIASGSSIPDISSPLIPSTSTEVNKPRTKEMDTDAITFPLRTHEELRSLEAALDNRNFRDHFIVEYPSGIPQGSVLGPLLFLIYVNDLSQQVSSDLLLFTDDVKLWREVCKQECRLELDEDLIRLQSWAGDNGLIFNALKYASMLTYDHIEASNVIQLAKELTNTKLPTDIEVEWLLKAICLIDLTTLAGDDTPVNVQRLCVKAVHPLSECVLNKIENVFNMNLQDLRTAAVCVYPYQVKTCAETFKKLKLPNFNIASVATGFPTGQYPLETRLLEIKSAINDGANEIDVVINRTLALQGDWEGN
ncbi:unnamed protein product [Schistosoma curassoni]|uniref:deoxyribose-phosphate aldolase n=1 Tax=Schistosoma curassoni TaxID=6186 RepID=A0A183KHQ5_9TREM|nr:unnamed protein product [Schistosoma curassoni]